MSLPQPEVQVQDKIILQAADNVRILSAAMVQKAKSGHPGGAMGAADALTLLFGEFLRFDPANPEWPARDRFFMDPGHMSPLLYSELALTGRLGMEDLAQFRQLGSRTPGHPELDLHLGIENTSGPLGLGHGFALGSAIAERVMVDRFGDLFAHKTVVLISDGGVQEEIAYGVGRIAGHLQLSNLIMFYDSNSVQLSCETKDAVSHDIAAQYRAWGWKVLETAGHDIAALRAAFTTAYAEHSQPVLVIGHTTMGKGAKNAAGEAFEGKVSTHGQPLDAAGASTAASVTALGGDAANPFQIFPAVRSAFDARLAELRKQAEAWQSRHAEWAKQNPQKAATHASWLASRAPALDLSVVPQKEGVATRVNSGNVLAWLAQNQKNMVCSSADLSNSDNTQAFLDQTGIFRPGDFSGAFLQPGVAELTMGAACCGIALHGGLIPVCATFFVFSDYMKPVMRIASLMGLPVKFMFTHDSFRVGEDGPTHEPIEHETQVRLLEELNHADGRPEMLVLRPADAAETTVAWEMAMANGKSPTTLILSRQNMAVLPVAVGTTRLIEARKSVQGAYVVSDNSEGKRIDLTFVANGSDVSLCCAAADLLRAEGKVVRVVSMISPKLFRNQPRAFRDSLLTPWTPVLALSSGLPLVFERVVGPLGRTLGLERFGASAPFTVLEKEFGYTPEAVADKARAYLSDYAADCAAFKQALG